MNNAPVIVFVYNRPQHALRTLEALSNNYLADQTKLYIYSDGPKENALPNDLDKIKEVRSIIKSKQWCAEVEIIERETNKGLDFSVIEGVTNVISKHKKVIVLEDDIVSSKYFLKFVNDALSIYEENKIILTVSGYIFPIEYANIDSVLLPLTSAWGWATWDDRWQQYNHSIPMKEIINNSKFLKQRFNIGDFQYTSILMKQGGEHWDIRWYYNLFMRNSLGVFPTKSLVQNIGFDGSGTNCETDKNIQDNKFDDIQIDIIKKNYIDLDFYALLHNYFKGEQSNSILNRIKNKIKSLLR